MSRDALVLLLMGLAFFYSLQTIQSFVLHVCVSIVADVLIPKEDREFVRAIVQPHVQKIRMILLDAVKPSVGRRES